MNVFSLQGLADIVDRQVLFAQLDNLLTYRIIPFDASAFWFGKELTLWILTKHMQELVETPQRVPKSFGDFGTWESLDEIGSQRFVLPMVGVSWGEKDVGQVH
jgi:hypothetical protein